MTRKRWECCGAARPRRTRRGRTLAELLEDRPELAALTAPGVVLAQADTGEA